MLLETAAAGLGQALINRWGTEGALGFFDRRRDAKALRAAITAAAVATDNDRDARSTFGRYDINRAFFDHEGADEIAKLLLSGAGPDPRELAHAAGADRSSDGPLVVAFGVLLEHLTTEMSAHGPFRERLAQVEGTRAASVGDADERELAVWLVERFGHLDTTGIGTTRHLQLLLNEVYVPARALRERQATERWGTREQQQHAVLAERLRAGELAHEDYEAELDRLQASHATRAGGEPEPVAVLEALRDVGQGLVLGEPGSGKTTLLRYLALQHAGALVDGRTVVTGELGRARLPLYVRAGDFARHRDRDRGLGAFIATYLLERLECPVDPGRLGGLITTRLQAGRCLVLIDGLDEVASAGERARVVEAIAGFAIAQRPRGNHVLCSSRIAGYAAAPLPPTFTALRLLDMDDAAIERFLGGYVPAIERREAPLKTDALVRLDAERTVRELLDAFGRTPGIRRLAANPLLLTALLLVHRTTGGLPERRVDAYKAVVDALGRTWRANQGVPEHELPDERHLTQWLTLLADWMHAERPEGTATLRDLLRVLGPLWADLNRRDWDHRVLQAAEPASTDAGTGILQFAKQIEQHCGLLVERAPGRWGFPHLTFEEFYAGRALAFPARARDRPTAIRQRLHDPRYDEPILLALGLVGRDYAGEIDDLVRTALLADDDEARNLGLAPTAHEDLLGRDFRFVLRALADDIPTTPRLLDALLNQALDELLHATGRGRFEPYRAAVLQRLGALKPVAAGRRAAALLAERVPERVVTDRARHQRLIEIASSCPAHPDVTERLELIATTDDSSVAIRAAQVLAGQGELAGAVVERLVELIATTDNSSVASMAAQVLAGQGELAGAVVERLVELIATTDNSYAASRAAQVLAGQGELAGAVVERLVELIATTDNSYAASMAAQVLAGQGELAGAVVERLVELIATTDDSYAAIMAAQVLAGQGELAGAVVERLVELIATTDNSSAAIMAAQVLAGQGELAGAVVERLVELIATTDNSSVAIRAAQVLAGQGELAGAVVERLVELIATTDNSSVAIMAAQVLAGQGELAGAVVERLVELIATTDNSSAAIRAAQVLAGQGELAGAVVERLVELIATTDNSSAASMAAQVLAGQGELAGAVVERLVELIATTDNSFAAIRAAQVLAGQGELAGAVVERLVELIATTDNSFAAIRAAQVLAGQGELAGAVVERLSQLALHGRSAAYHALWHP